MGFIIPAFWSHNIILSRSRRSPVLAYKGIFYRFFLLIPIHTHLFLNLIVLDLLFRLFYRHTFLGLSFLGRYMHLVSNFSAH